MNIIVLFLLSLGGLFGGQPIDNSQLQAVRDYVEVNNIEASDIQSEVEKYAKENNITEAQKQEYLARVEDYEPTASITELRVVNRNTIKVTYNLKDDRDLLLHDSTYSPEVRLYKGNTLVDSVPAKVGTDRHAEFTGLDRSEEYKVVISGPYDLLGYGTPYNVDPYSLAEQSITTDKLDPTANIHLTTDIDPTEVGYSTIEVHYDLIDPDNALMIDPANKIEPKVVIYKVGVDEAIKGYEATVGTNQVQTFSKLEPDTEYKVVVKGKYDLNSDGNKDNDAPFTLAEETFRTSATKIVPTGLIHTETDVNPTVVGEDNIEVHFDLNDKEKALINDGSIRPKLVVYKGSELVYVGSVQVGENEIEPVGGLENNTTYTVNLTGQYDLDEDGVVDNTEPYILDSEDFTTGTTDPTVPEGFIGVSTCKDLESIGRGVNYPGASHTEAWSLSDDYALTQDIDCSATNPSSADHDTSLDTTYGSDGFEPIGQNSEFRGILDGQEYTIDGLYINEPNETYIGLIGKLSEGTAKDLNLTNIYMSGAFNIGAIVGNSVNGVVSDVSVEGNVYAKDNVSPGGSFINNIGAIVGKNSEGTIENAKFTGLVVGSSQVGGITGENSGSVRNSNAYGIIRGKDQVGGIVGANAEGEVLSSGYNGSVQGESRLGGVVGENEGQISNCFSNVEIQGNDDLGGVVGQNDDTISNSYSIADITGVKYIGGISGTNKGDISNTYSVGSLEGKAEVGGIVGGTTSSIATTIVNSYSTVNIEADSYAGGIIGRYYSTDTITNSYKYENQVVTGADNTEGDVVTAAELNDSNWYTNTLGFDNNWNIALVSDGYYPHVMKNDLSGEVDGQDNIVYS